MSWLQRRPPARMVVAISAAAWLALWVTGGAAQVLREVPSFAAEVAAGALPPIGARLPAIPSRIDQLRYGRTPGRQGGTLRTLVGRAKDTRMMVVYGYARLVAYDPRYQITPDILERVEVEDGRIFTLHLREGHRWSDGHPFTAEDFRYYWEDVAKNPTLSPSGIPRALTIDGAAPRFELLDARTVRYSWPVPNPYFLPALAGSVPLYIYRPAHYLKDFHIRYADPDALKQRVDQARRRNWAALHNRRDNQYKNDNPALPTLQPWVLRTKPPARRFVFARNPYFHRIDMEGRQLPYIDRVVMNVVDSKIIPLKTGAGESALQARGLNFSDYTFLKDGEQENGYKVRLWRTAKGAHIALFPNLNAKDETWRSLFRDTRFRRALSLAIDRHEINQVVYFGLAIEGNNTVLPASNLFEPRYRAAWTGFDLAAAAALLDEIGLKRPNRRGLRLLPDGRPMEIVVETAGEDSEQADVLELIHDNWLKIGIKLYTRPSQREVFRNRIFAGETLMSVWSGLENGIPNADTPPDELAPTSQQQLQWPKWGQYYETKGRSGEKVDVPAAERLSRLARSWRDAADTKAQARIWAEMLQIHADEQFSIGIIAGVFQPVVASAALRNLPEKGVYNWEPGAHFGVYRPDSLWLAVPAAAAAK